MIAVFCFCPRDEDQALKNAVWMLELGKCKGHEAMVGYDPRCNPVTVEAIGAQMLKVFDRVFRLKMEAEVDDWPEGANYFFTRSCTWLKDNVDKWPYFLWLEPDAIPLREGWLDALEAQYKRGGKPFMGDRVQVEDIPLHMSGVGFYQNPIYLLAGEAYRAHDTAWDMAAKDQIVPNAHFTDLIEHAWKHPTFHDLSELATQIAPQTILFHSSKDGSLIDLLRKKNFSVPVLAELGYTPVANVNIGNDQRASEARGSTGASSGHLTPEGMVLKSEAPQYETPRGGEPIYDIFIRTYPGDYEWLAYCMKSIKKFVTGFRKIWIVSPSPAPNGWFFGSHVEWRQMNDETEDGYLAQQITKLYADVLCDYQADYILHVDSDVIFTRPTTPQDFFVDGKVNWYYTPYEVIRTPWQPIIEKFMGFTVPYEFMRRLPMMIPRWLYPRMREFCHSRHGLIISEYIRTQPMRAFSEFNALGAYAYLHHRDKFHFRHTQEEGPMPEPFAKQFHSWSGLTPEIKFEIETLLSGAVEGPPSGNQAPHAQIKVLPSGVWVLEGDQISGWVEQEGRLDHDQNLLPVILKHINPGDTVVDAGAFIGDHTVAYVKAVGESGMVHAFEPNPMAFECLTHNTRAIQEVTLHDCALGDGDYTKLLPLSGNNGNWGGAYIGEHMKVADVFVRPLETLIPWRVNFIKIDVEGYELKVLQGAGNLINRCRPRMVIEINREALGRQGADPEDVYLWLCEHQYSTSIIQENCSLASPLYDILCLPEAAHPDSVVQDTRGASAQRFPVVSSAPPPARADGLLSERDKMIIYIDWLKAFSEKSVYNRTNVMQRLSYAGLKKKVYKKKHP